MLGAVPKLKLQNAIVFRLCLSERTALINLDVGQIVQQQNALKLQQSIILFVRDRCQQFNTNDNNKLDNQLMQGLQIKSQVPLNTNRGQKQSGKTEFLFNLRLNRYRNSPFKRAFQNEQNSRMNRARTQIIQEIQTKQSKCKAGSNIVKTNSVHSHKTSRFSAFAISKEEIMSCINKQIKSKNICNQSFDTFFDQKKVIFRNGVTSIFIKKKQQGDCSDLSMMAAKMASTKKIEAPRDYEENKIEEKRKKLNYIQNFMVTKFNVKFKKMNQTNEEVENQKRILFEIGLLRQQKAEQKNEQRRKFKSEPKHIPNLKPWEQNQQIELVHKLKASRPFFTKRNEEQDHFDVILN